MTEVKSLSRARLFATPRTVAGTKLLHPCDFLGKSTGMGWISKKFADSKKVQINIE